jgi:hypothetical protein
MVGQSQGAVRAAAVHRQNQAHNAYSPESIPECEGIVQSKCVEDRQRETITWIRAFSLRVRTREVIYSSSPSLLLIQARYCGANIMFLLRFFTYKKNMIRKIN